jgi:hypothetical protein
MRFNMFISFIEQGWFLIVIYDYVRQFNIWCEKISENNNIIKLIDYQFFKQLKNILVNLQEYKVSLNTAFYPIDSVVKNPYLESALYNDFNNIINNKIINFNYNYYLELNDILFEDINITEEDLYKEFIIYNLFKNFSYSSNLSYFIINNLFFDINKLIHNE